ncbi:MAG: GNAT family N-acetyltransferase [Deltaproteobacteria bacterium]|nr:GNAT family N-acetyltransferase [Deltaproteobacteria bacterium]
MLRLRRATPADLPAIFPRTRALNAHEGIAVAPDALEAALRNLLAEPTHGGVWLIERADDGATAARDATVVGYAIVTFGYDLEFAGRDAWLTELWVDEAARGSGAGTAALDQLDAELRPLGVRALHLQVRPENPALRLYERAGFERSPRYVLTRKL